MSARPVASMAVGLLALGLTAAVMAQTWTHTDTRRQAKADTSYAPAEWKTADGSAAALKQWVTVDGRRMTISTTCSWKGIPGGLRAGEPVPVSVQVDQLQNTQTGYDSSVKLYFGEEGGTEADGPDAMAGWRDGTARRSGSGTVVAPKGGTRRFAIRAHCKVAGDAYDTIYYYTYGAPPAPGATPAPAGPAVPGGPPAAAAVPGWAGTWSTSFGAMTLEASGDRVTGRYDYKGGRIDGQVAGTVLRGTWVQDNARGSFVFRLGADGRRFEGSWGRGASDDNGGAWTGRRR